MVWHKGTRSPLASTFSTGPESGQIAESVADVLRAGFGRSARVFTKAFDGRWFVVVSVLGDGKDYLFDASAIDSGRIRSEFRGGWVPGTWLRQARTVADRKVAAAYYLETGRHLHLHNTGMTVLTRADEEVLEVARGFLSGRKSP